MSLYPLTYLEWLQVDTDGASQALSMQLSQPPSSPAQHKPQFSRRFATLETNITSSNVFGGEMAFAEITRTLLTHSESIPCRETQKLRNDKLGKI
jgi:hypothetical protein